MHDNPGRPLALVTGASSGIGAELARELARGGHDLLLVARRLPELEAMAAELRGAGGTVEVISMDLSTHDAAVRLAAQLRTQERAVDVLINNAGFGDVGPFDHAEPGTLEQMLQLNIVALTMLTRELLPGMIARGRGRVMFVASTAAFQPGPNMAAYCASKAYVLSLGEAIAYELRGTGVTVTTLCPGATDTGFAAAARAESLAIFRGGPMPRMTAAAVARAGYRAMMRGRRVIVTGIVNKIVAVSSSLAPRGVVLAIAHRLLASDS
jgi:uncharacterized protein